MRDFINASPKYFVRSLMLVSVFGLSSCVIHTVENTPKPSVASADTFSLDQRDEDVRLLPGAWWESLDRAGLNALIEQVLENNQDIRAALAVVKQAQAVTTQTNAQRLPNIALEGDADKDWQGSDGQRGTAQIGAALDWEIDIFNRIGNAVKADRLEVVARREDVQALKLSLSAEVANAYFGAVAANQRIKLLQDQLRLDKELLNLLQLRLDNGVGTTVDVLQQKARVADSQTLIPRAQSDMAVFENRIDVLLGAFPDAQPRVESTDTLDFADEIPFISVPSSLLLNRPDLRAAQADLVAADADIGAAIADRLPRVTLSGVYAYTDSAGYTGPVLGLLGNLMQPLLDWGQRKAEVERNKAVYEERLAAFTQLYLEAVEDVENALIQERKQREFLHRLRIQRDILKQTVSASEDRYRQGIDDYVLVINALQELREVERSLITERLELVNIRIALFRAIGGSIIPSMDNQINNEENHEN